MQGDSLSDLPSSALAAALFWEGHIESVTPFTTDTSLLHKRCGGGGRKRDQTPEGLWREMEQGACLKCRTICFTNCQGRMLGTLWYAWSRPTHLLNFRVVCWIYTLNSYSNKQNCTAGKICRESEIGVWSGWALIRAGWVNTFRKCLRVAEVTRPKWGKHIIDFRQHCQH